MKKWITMALVLALLASFAGCGSSEGGIPVQRADQLALAGKAGERYAGVVVSENVVEITRDSSKRIDELYVAVGQEVKAGDKLITFDPDFIRSRELPLITPVVISNAKKFAAVEAHPNMHADATTSVITVTGKEQNKPEAK